MRENYAVSPGQTLTITVQVDDAPSRLTGPLYKAAVDAERELVAAERDRENLITELDKAVARIAELEQGLTARDHLLREATTTLAAARRIVWTTGLDVLMEERGIPGRVEDHAAELAQVVGRVRATIGQP